MVNGRIVLRYTYVRISSQPAVIKKAVFSQACGTDAFTYGQQLQAMSSILCQWVGKVAVAEAKPVHQRSLVILDINVVQLGVAKSGLAVAALKTTVIFELLTWLS